MVLTIRVGRIDFNLRQVLGFVIFVIAWWLLARQLGQARLPSPQAVAARFVKVLSHSPEIAAQGGGSSGIGPHLVASIIRVFAGGTVGICLGAAVGLLMGWNKHVNDLLEPPIEILRAIPPLALAPFLLIWFGPTTTTQFIMLIGYTCLVLVISTIEAIKNVPPVQIQYTQTLGASSIMLNILPIPNGAPNSSVTTAMPQDIAIPTRTAPTSSGTIAGRITVL